MNRQRRLLILSGVLFISIAGVLVISKIDFEEKMVGEETAIVDVESSKITSLSWDYDGEVSFDLVDGEWKYTEDDKMPVDQEKLDQIAEDLSDITSDKKVKEVKSLSIYGLSEPKYSLRIGTADKTYEISIGDETFSDGEVYISIGDDYVYLTDAGLIDKISYSLLDLVQQEEIPEMETVTSISIDNGSSVKLVYKENSGYCYSDAYTYYIKEGDSYKNLDNEDTEDTFQSLTDFSWSECVDYNAEDAELSTYGLDAPAASVSIKYQDEEGNKKEFSYDVGTKEDEYYAKLKDSQIVYSMDASVYDAAVDASYQTLQPDEVLLLDWETVKSIDIEMDGSKYTIQLEKKDEDGFKYSLEGTEIDLADVLDDLSGITIEQDEKEEIGANKEEISFTFHRSTEEDPEVELVFYQYDGTYCIPVRNGETLDCVKREDVVALKEAINSVILNKGNAEKEK